MYFLGNYNKIKFYGKYKEGEKREKERLKN